MLEMESYGDLVPVYAGKSFSLFRGIQRSGRAVPVLIKTFSTDAPKRHEYNYLWLDYELSSGIQSEYLLVPLELRQLGERVFTVWQDVPGIPLSKFISQYHTLHSDYEYVVRVFIRLAQALEALHTQKLILRSLHPAHVLIDPATLTVKIAGLGYSTFTSSAMPEPDVEWYETDDLFRYIAPEQTGRMNAAVDQRANIYSLGIIFYECLTRRLPFDAPDLLGMLHAHVAQEPPTLHMSNPAIPPALEAIVQKMLAKNAADRYQSARGVVADLKKLVQTLAAAQTAIFPLGQEDVSDVFTFPEKIVGREKEVQKIIRALEKEGRQRFEAVFVSGESGIGKSALIREARARLNSRDLYFLIGTCKNFNGNMPYSGITEAVRSIVEQILTLPEARANAWKQMILSALAGQGKLMTNIIPELELLLGQQPELPEEATPEAAENRLKNAFLRLIDVLTQTDKKIILFLNDLHLAEPASIDLLYSLIKNREQYKLLLIGTFVDNGDEGLTRLLASARDTADAQLIALHPLSKADIRDLVSEALKTGDRLAPRVVDVLHEKTKGIPIFLREFLGRANQDGALFFDYTANAWRWNIDQIARLPISDNVAGLIRGQVRKLPEKTITLLQTAACIGSRFDVDTLAILLEQSAGETARDLGEALQAGFVGPDQETISLRKFKLTAYPEQEAKWYAFTHDRLRQAVYDMAPEQWCAHQHYRIGSYLLQRHGTDDSRMYEIANHWSAGLGHISAADVAGAIDIFVAAGKKAKLAVSYSLAFRYFDLARQLLIPDSWKKLYRHTFDLYAGLIECGLLCGQTEAGEQFFTEAAACARDKVDLARLHVIKLDVYVYLNELKSSFREGLAAIKLLGRGLPEKPSQLYVLREIIKTGLLLKGKSHNGIIAQPLMSDPKAKLLDFIYLRCLPYAYTNSPELFAVISMRQLRNSLRYGLGIHSYSGFGVYGGILAVGFGQYAKGFAYNELSLKIAQKVGAPVAIGGAYFALAMNGFFIHAVQRCIEWFAIALEHLNRAGESVSANAAAYSIISYSIVSGKPLPGLKERAESFLIQAHTNKQAHGIEILHWLKTFIDLLTTPETAVESMPDPHRLLQENYPSFTDFYRGMYYIQWMQLYYCFGVPEHTLEMATYAEKLEKKVLFSLSHTDFHYYRALAAAQLYETATPELKKQYRSFIRQAGALLTKRARFSPDNFQHKSQVINGLKSLIAHRHADALSIFDTLGGSLPPDKHLHDAGHVAQMAFSCALRLGHIRESVVYFEKSRRAFDMWGARAIGQQLTKQYQDVMGAFQQAKPAFSGTSQGSVDFKSVLKASQLLSGEIELSKLLDSLIRLAMENAGAQRGFLLVEQNEHWRIEAEGVSGQETTLTLQGKALNEGQLASSIVLYVARTRKRLTLDDAIRDERFGADPYIMQYKPKSVICRPIIRQGTLIGILYLENNLAYNAFTPDRQEALELLSAQAAISLQNAFLYDQVTALNRAYERFVPREFLNFLGKKTITDVGLGDHVQQEMTVMFADIRQFTNLSEQLSPRDNFRFINDYLGVMEPCIIRRGGFIDKYIGDAIMALFPGSADDALQAALDMLAELETFNRTQQRDIRIGIGLNTGNLILGTVGSEQRMDGTVISDAVNLTARVENLTKRYGVHFLLTENTYQKLENPARYPIRRIDYATVQGKTDPVTLYEVCAGSPPEQDALKMRDARLFEEATDLFGSQHYANAAAIFERILAANPADRPAQFWLERVKTIN